VPERNACFLLCFALYARKPGEATPGGRRTGRGCRLAAGEARAGRNSLPPKNLRHQERSPAEVDRSGLSSGASCHLSRNLIGCGGKWLGLVDEEKGPG